MSNKKATRVAFILLGIGVTLLTTVFVTCLVALL